MDLDASGVPASGTHLIPLAHRWAIGDDFDREAAVSSASHEELRLLVAAVEATGDDFWDWLAGDESYAPRPSQEYIALTLVTMAADSARVELARASAG